MLKILPDVPIPQPTFDIRDEIIAKATRKCSRTCAIAQCIRIDHGGSSVNVTAESISYNAMGMDRDGKMKMMRYRFAMPPVAAVNFIKWDETGIMKPFKFRVQKTGAFARPVVLRPKAPRRGPTRKRTPPSITRTPRRYHGLRVVEVKAA